MVERLVEAGLVKRRGRVRTDSTHVLAAVRKLNRVELVAETLRVALEELAAADEDWLAALITPQWGRRYGRPVRYERLPRGKDELATHALQVGRDGMRVLEAVHAVGAPRRLRDLPAIDVLRRVWVQQYWTDAHGDLAWRAVKASRDRQGRHGRPRRSASADGEDLETVIGRTPWSGIEILSPHDPEARYCRKDGATSAKSAWIGYRDHQSETCDDDVPNVIVGVVTRPASVQYINVVDDIHAGLAASGLAPHEHLVDSGYVTPDVIHHAARRWGIALLGPVRADPRGRPGFTKEDFHINWEDRTLTCPRGVTSPPWRTTLDNGKPRLSVLFPKPACRTCADRTDCTGDTTGKGRRLTLLPEPLQKIQTNNRKDQHTELWKARYALRADCEATVSETTRAHGLRNCRYQGLAKTHVQHVLTAAGTNITRLADHYTPGINPDRPPRPTSPLQRLCRRLPAQPPE